MTKKIKGATLIESLIAMVIVMLCFGIATTVYVNVISSQNQFQQFKSEVLLKRIASETKDGYLFLDEKIIMDEIVVQKTIIQYGGMKHLVQIKLQAYNNAEKLLSEYNELVAIQ